MSIYTQLTLFIYLEKTALSKFTQLELFKVIASKVYIIVFISSRLRIISSERQNTLDNIKSTFGYVLYFLRFWIL